MRTAGKKSLIHPHFCAVILLPLLLIVISGGVFAQQSPAPKAVAEWFPDILVLVFAQNPAAPSVSVNYTKLVKKDQVEADLRRLVNATGWTATNIRITNESAMPSGQNPTTTVEFTSSPMPDIGSGALVIEPTIVAFKDLSKIEIDYVLTPAATLRALGDYENDYVKIAQLPGPGSYRYRVHVKDHNFQKLNLPIPPPPGQEPKPEPPPASRAPLVILVVVLAMGVAAIAYLITANAIRRHRG
jgi:hypothetical protein